MGRMLFQETFHFLRPGSVGTGSGGIITLLMKVGEGISAQKGRLFLWAPVAFGAGIAFYFALPREPWAGMGAALSLAMAGPLWALYRRHRDGPVRFAAYIGGLGFLLAFLGFFAAQMETQFRGTAILPGKTGAVTIEGTIAQVEKLEDGKGSRVVLADPVIEDVLAEATPRSIRLTFKKDAGLVPGARIRTLGELDAPSRASAPGSYDFRRHLYHEGIGGVGFAYRPAEVLTPPPRRGGPSLFFERMRLYIAGEIEEKAGSAAAPIMNALITGERGAIEERDNEAMRNSGLYHLLSISGAHVGMVAGVLFFCARLMMAAWPWFALRYSPKKIAAVISILGAAFYVVLAGSDIPALRSLMMTGLVMLAILLDRSPFSLRLVAFAALAVMIFSPHSLAGVSFQMSFAAVAAMIAFFDYSRPWWSAWRTQSGFFGRAMLYLLAVLVTSLIAGVMTGLFSLYHFQNFSVYGLLANMLAVPLTAVVIMPAAIAAMILMPFGWDGPALMMMEWGTVWMLAIAHWAGGLEGAVLHTRQWPGVSFVLICAGVIVLIVWQGWRGKGAAAIMMMMAVVIGAATKGPDILIADGGKLQAVGGGDGTYYISTRRGDKFSAENWMRQNGQAGERPKLFRDEGSPMLCDSTGCRGVINGVRVSIVRHMSAVREECAWATVLIAEIPVRDRYCKGPDVIVDLFDAKDRGAQALRIGRDGAVDVRSVAREVGDRPWRGGK